MFVSPVSRLVLLSLVVALLAGCTSASDDLTPTQADPQAPADAGPDRFSTPSNSTTSALDDLPKEDVYQFSGLIVGASPPNPNGTGPTLDQLPPPQEETFVAPNGTVHLEFVAARPDGTGSMRIEVMGPDGAEVYHSNAWKQVGWAGQALMVTAMDEQAVDGLGPGTYTVVYYVAGAFEVEFTVTASLGAEAPAEPGPT